MATLGERISSSITGVECPVCEKKVVPTFLEGSAEADEATMPEGRWSFVWRPTSGYVCPECKFPIERYAHRLKWIRLLSVGVVAMSFFILLWVVDLMGGVGEGLRLVRRALGAIGAVAILVGAFGIILGGRRRR